MALEAPTAPALGEMGVLSLLPALLSESLEGLHTQGTGGGVYV